MSVPETRSSATDAVVSAILANAAGGKASAGATAAAEIGAGTISRGLAAARLVEAPDMLAGSLTPEVMALVGRALVRSGEALLVPVGDALFPAHSWTVTGPPLPALWSYRATLAGPSGSLDLTVPGPEVLHFRWSRDPARPWAGTGPLQGASLTGEILAEAEGQIRDEAKGPRGKVITQGTDSETALKALTDKLKALKGGLALVESTRAGATTFGAAPNRDWVPERYGYSAPESLEAVRTRAGRDVLAACGVPVELIEVADGTGQREAYRRFLHTTLEPLGRMIAAEVRRKMDAPAFAFDFRGLMASDLAGRARAFQSLVGGGMDVTEALALTGLLADAD